MSRLGNWLRSWFRAQMPRDIFEFWDGTRYRRVDPLVVCRSIDNHKEFNAEQHSKLVDMGDDEGIAITAKAVRDAFGVEALSTGGGMTETECCDLLKDFWNWCGEVKKKRNPSPISHPPMEPQHSETSMPNSSSDFGSTFPVQEEETVGL